MLSFLAWFPRVPSLFSARTTSKMPRQNNHTLPRRQSVGNVSLSGCFKHKTRTMFCAPVCHAWKKGTLTVPFPPILQFFPPNLRSGGLYQQFHDAVERQYPAASLHPHPYPLQTRAAAAPSPVTARLILAGMGVFIIKDQIVNIHVGPYPGPDIVYLALYHRHAVPLLSMLPFKWV